MATTCDSCPLVTSKFLRHADRKKPFIVFDIERVSKQRGWQASEEEVRISWWAERPTWVITIISFLLQWCSCIVCWFLLLPRPGKSVRILVKLVFRESFARAFREIWVAKCFFFFSFCFASTWLSWKRSRSKWNVNIPNWLHQREREC